MGCRWSSHVSLAFSQPTRHLSNLSSNFPRLVTSSPSINFIALTSYYTYQPRHIYGTSPLDCLKTRVAIMPVDKTDKVCRSNAVWDFGGVQSMVTTQLKLIANGKAVKCQKIEEFIWYIRCFAIEQVVKVPEKAHLACSIARLASCKTVLGWKLVRPVW